MLKQAPAPGFDDPLGLLRACHQRIIGFCDLLDRLPEHLTDQGTDAALLSAVSQVLRYFDIAAPLHHQDEDIDLFPRLTGLPGLAPLMTQLGTEHRLHEQHWQRLAAALRQLEQGATSNGIDALIATFTRAMREHVELENTQILPAAQAHLTPAQRQRIGAAMQARRQT